MTLPDISVRRATQDDAAALAELMGAAFMDDPVSGWLFEAEEDRHRLHAGFFRPFVDLTLGDGVVHTTRDQAGVTLWLPVDATVDSNDNDKLAWAIEEAIGPEYFKRFSVLDGLMTDNHPHSRDHAYLPFIAVHPARHSTGLGTALLRHRFAELDAMRTPAYLEASSVRSAALYARLGFRRLPFTLDLPEGPSLYPMWREPGTACQPGSKG